MIDGTYLQFSQIDVVVENYFVCCTFERLLACPISFYLLLRSFTQLSVTNNSSHGNLSHQSQVVFGDL